MKKIAAIALTIACFGQPGVALAEVDVRTPWTDVYVGHQGVYVNGPWGRVAVPSEDRERVCASWRRNVERHYKRSGCEVDFDDDGCTIDEVECHD